jgi:hypothetical protein
MNYEEERMKNIHYHSEEKGCLMDKNIEKYRNGKTKDSAYCLTHEKECCRCGWEWGWHLGTKTEN